MKVRIGNIAVDSRFEKRYRELLNKYGENICRLNGIAEEQLNSDNFLVNVNDCEAVADISIDGSANVTNKDITTILSEMHKSENKLQCLNKVYTEIIKLSNKATADEWLEREWVGYLYLHDGNTSSFIPYCYAHDLKPLAEQGLFFVSNINPEAPKHLETFIDFVKEYINFVSNRQSGAVGLPNLIPYMYYFWKKDVDNHYMGLSEEYAEKFAKQHIQRFIYAINQPYVRNGIQSAFTNTSIFDHEYLMALFGGSTFPDGSFMIDEFDGIMTFQKWFMEEMSEVKSHNMFTFPVNSISMLKTESGEIVDEEFAKWAIEHNMKWSDSNLFVSTSVTSLSNCCRLKSDIDNLGFFSSIGGTALSVGSVKVSTINLARISYESATEEEYLERLAEIVKIDCEALNAVRHIIKRNVEKGWLKNFTYELMDFSHLYNTIGVLGVYETFKTFGYVKFDELGNCHYTKDAERFGKRIFEVINAVKDEYAKDKDYLINIEQVPAETCASKLMQKDEYFCNYNVVNDLPLYGNQFVPLGVQATLQERTRVASLFDSYCNGGSILHINIDSPFTNFEQAWKMFNYVVQQNVTYFAFNTKINVCKNKHSFYDTKCPVCGGKVTDTYTRIVGFYVPISSFSKERKEEYKLRQWG